MDSFVILGIMSGTSLDGLDLALCRFTIRSNWQYELLRTECIPYPLGWQERLRRAPECSGLELQLLDVEYGVYIGELVKQFLGKASIQPGHIACHGHTVFHQPEKKLTLQIGNGQAIASACGLPVINQFRNKDVLMGGQGAPLVPIGDRLLFPQADYCMNIGGIANISFEEKGQRKAYDVCPANMVLNALSAQRGKAYDESGSMAKSGTVQLGLLDKLNALDYYGRPYPKSLGKEWVDENVYPLLGRFSIEDELRTMTEHIAQQCSNAFKKEAMVLVSGGGAYNSFLLERIQAIRPDLQLLLPDSILIEFKEALIFALLGVLFLNNEPNCLASVTGASKDVIGGVYYRP